MSERARVADIFAVAKLWRRQSAWLLLGLLVSLIAVACGVALLAQSGRTLAAALVGGTLAVPVLLRAIGLGRVLGRYAERLLTHDATFRALTDLRVWFFRGLSRSAAGGLGFRRSGDVLSRLVNDVEALDGLYLRIAIPLAAAILLLPVLLWFVGPANAWLAAVLALLFAAGAFAIPAMAGRRAMHDAGETAHTISALRVAALDLLGGLREARAFNAEDRLLAEIQHRQVAHQTALTTLAGNSARAQAAGFLCAQAATLAVVAIIAYGRPMPRLIAVSVAFLTVAIFEAAAGLPRAGALAGTIAAAAHRVVQAATRPDPVPYPSHPAALPIGTSLRFENVDFTYALDQPMVLQNFSLDIPRGSRIALLGPSGAGKSTVAALALRVASPQSGRVLLGGVDLAQLRPEDVRERNSWLSQATHLFDDTIAANLRLARPDADDAALWTALETARIADTVRALPDGLQTWVGEAGQKFSGGQSRRLALARALLSPAPILILDEPCAGLDSQTEQEFLQTLNDAAPNRSILLIVHRLTGVERLDRIFRLTAGHAVAAAG